ncbi:hypothetical protein CesoFtcFv8_011667 [Champsocephalus esox]|uniref:Uncharacterized protein n=2 Tax=Champsocephalus TaxID=52236 RepID=A0AAN8DJM9_CHAGU|nr:hypothetical protein CesoFtcFv8_011667 [Champsocephalus esox]KAK5924061.1 hypothetical protein CgunFtcFv8_000969 [Champsocephalus gunnari]
MRKEEIMSLHDSSSQPLPYILNTVLLSPSEEYEKNQVFQGQQGKEDIVLPRPYSIRRKLATGMAPY